MLPALSVNQFSQMVRYSDSPGKVNIRCLDSPGLLCWSCKRNIP